MFGDDDDSDPTSADDGIFIREEELYDWLRSMQVKYPQIFTKDDTLFGDRALFDVLLMDDHFGTMRGLHDDTTSITTANRNNNNNNDECYHHEHRQHRRSSISSDTTDNNNVILDCSYRSSTFF